MNPGKRRKLQKIEFLKKRIEENVKKLEETINVELEQLIVEEVNFTENTPVVTEPEVKISKKKKVV